MYSGSLCRRSSSGRYRGFRRNSQFAACSVASSDSFTRVMPPGPTTRLQPRTTINISVVRPTAHTACLGFMALLIFSTRARTAASDALASWSETHAPRQPTGSRGRERCLEEELNRCLDRMVVPLPLAGGYLPEEPTVHPNILQPNAVAIEQLVPPAGMDAQGALVAPTCARRPKAARRIADGQAEADPAQRIFL